VSVPNPLPSYGYVAPSGTNGELNDQDFRRFLQSVIVGITGMDPTMVRPRWQPEPPNEPDFTTDWAAIGVIERDPDTFASVTHTTDEEGNGTDLVVRNEVLSILASFYGPNAEKNSKLLVNGFALAQNREGMQINGFGLLSAGKPIQVPALLKERWLIGWDVPFRVRHQEAYGYPIPNLKSAQATLDVQGVDVSIKVSD
jgi:hypothetical protein